MSAETKNNIKFSIRAMSVSDLDIIMDIEKEVFPDPWSKNMFKEQVSGGNWGGLVAENESGIIGYACYYISSVEGHLTNIAVKPEFRRKSIAKKLLENVIDIVLQEDCEFILLEVRPSNKSAVLFYEKYGFGLLYKRPNYYSNPKEDAFVMVKYFEEKES